MRALIKLQDTKSFTFSVLISIYYKEKASNFNQCLESLANQTVQASEIIIVKDGILTGELEKTILSWQEKLPLTVVGYEENRGLAYALNYGLQYCTGDYIARMDSDDICMSDRFAEQLNCIYNNPDTVIIGSNILEFYEKSDTMLYSSERVYPSYLNKESKELYRVTPVAHPTVIIKADILRQYKYTENIGQNEDTDLWFRLLSDGYYITNINKVLLKFRITDNSFNRRNYNKALSELKIRWFYLSQFHGISILLIYPVLRFITRLLPSKIMKKLYFSKIRMRILHKTV
jgi:glycosyltransferase involved in cell wall biosynthesis